MGPEHCTQARPSKAARVITIGLRLRPLPAACAHATFECEREILRDGRDGGTRLSTRARAIRMNARDTSLINIIRRRTRSKILRKTRTRMRTARQVRGARARVRPTHRARSAHAAHARPKARRPQLRRSSRRKSARRSAARRRLRRRALRARQVGETHRTLTKHVVTLSLRCAAPSASTAAAAASETAAERSDEPAGDGAAASDSKDESGALSSTSRQAEVNRPPSWCAWIPR